MGLLGILSRQIGEIDSYIELGRLTAPLPRKSLGLLALCANDALVI